VPEAAGSCRSRRGLTYCRSSCSGNSQTHPPVTSRHHSLVPVAGQETLKLDTAVMRRGCVETVCPMEELGNSVQIAAPANPKRDSSRREAIMLGWSTAGLRTSRCMAYGLCAIESRTSPCLFGITSFRRRRPTMRAPCSARSTATRWFVTRAGSQDPGSLSGRSRGGRP